MASTVNAIFALLLLTSGYFLLRRWGLSRAHLFRSDGHALYFLVVGASFALALFTTLIWRDVVQIPLLGIALSDWMAKLLSIFTADDQSLLFGTTAVLSLPLAFFLAALLNIPLRRCISLRGKLLLRLSCLSELEEFLWMTSLRRLPVMVTLGSSKVYVGYTMDEPPRFRGESEWVRLEPLLSGYRDDEHRFIPTTNYGWLHNSPTSDDGISLQPSDFDVLVPTGEIKSVHAFDLPSFATKFQGNDDSSTPAATRGPRLLPSDQPRSKAENWYWAFVILLLLSPLSNFIGGGVCWIVAIFLCVLFAAAATLDEE